MFKWKDFLFNINYFKIYYSDQILLKEMWSGFGVIN